MTSGENGELHASGINHIAIMCKNMATTLHFYRDILGFPLVKTLILPDDIPHVGGMQHFFLDTGGKALLAFMWYPETPKPAPGVASAPVGGGFSAPGSMNHLAINVEESMLERYRQRLIDHGIEVSPIINHDDSRASVSPEVNETTYVRSIYFTDPDGIRLELAAWVRDLTPEDALLPPIELDTVPLPHVPASTT